MDGARLLRWESGEKFVSENSPPYPDILLYDISANPLSFHEYVARLKGQFPAMPVILFADELDPETVTRGIAAGATAFVDTSELISQFHGICETAVACL